MVTSSEPRPCTVVVTVDANPDVLETLIGHARTGLDRFREYRGFLRGRLHVSRDRGRMVQVLDWASEADYVTCRDDPVWDELASTRHFLETVRSGRALMDARTFQVEASTEPTEGSPA